MKGPFERLKYDGRRMWECPVCKHRERCACHVTSHLCKCQEALNSNERVWMKLIEDGVRRMN